MSENLRPIPEGSGEKRYTVVCHTKEGVGKYPPIIM